MRKNVTNPSSWQETNKNQEYYDHDLQSSNKNQTNTDGEKFQWTFSLTVTDTVINESSNMANISVNNNTVLMALKFI